MAAKNIDRSRIEQGRVVLPKKLNFLAVEKVEYLSVIDKDGEFSVVLSGPELQKLVKARQDLKAFKATMRLREKNNATEVSALKATVESLQADLAKAAKRIGTLDKRAAGQKAATKAANKAEATVAAPVAAAEPAATPAKVAKAPRAAKPVKKAAPVKPAAKRAPKATAAAAPAPAAAPAVAADPS